MDFEEKTLNSEVIYEGRIITVHVDDVELPDGTKAKREVVEHSGGVCVAALTDNDELLFVRQFRYPYKRELLELPAGKLEKGENPLEAGIRELEEECGVIAEKVFSLGTVYPTVAYCSEIIHLYGATGLRKTEQHLDMGEFLSVERKPLDEAVRMVMNGEISDSKTVALVLKIAKLKETGEI
ncbi:MAG: NUDIX hydrolase [Clostridia bacterium]|nr:NUDIX hydrolase [Clostridia bacterium]